ncbi:MAG: restriction endonuclease subunit S [Pyrinomonadaceae bacterium]
MKNWKDTKIEDFFDYTIPGDWGDEPSLNDSTAVIGTSNFRNDGKISFENLTYRKIAKSRLEKRQINKGDILIEKSGGSTDQLAGRVVYCDSDFGGTCSNFVEVAKVKENLDSQFVFYLLFHLYQSGRVAKYQQQTTGIINFKLTEYKKEKVKIPKDKTEQTKIAEVLSSVDEAIEQTEKLIEKQKRIKRGLLQDLLTKGIDENGTIRSEATHEFKDSPLGKIPKEWEAMKLLDVVPLAEYGISESLDEIGETPVLRMNNLQNGEVSLKDLKYSNGYEAKRVLLKPNDVLFNRTNSLEHVGKTAIWRGKSKTVSFASYLVRLIPDLNKLLPEFLNYWLNFDKTQIAIRLYASIGVHQVNINPTNLRKTLIAKPIDLSEQERIIELLNVHKMNVNAELKSLKKLKTIKTGLMQDLLTEDAESRISNLL